MIKSEYGDIYEPLLKLRKWARDRGMGIDPKTYKGYHFTTLYPTHIEEFWDLIDQLDNFIHETFCQVKNCEMRE